MNQGFLDCGAGKSEICKAHFSLATDDPAAHNTGDIFFLEGTSVLLLQPLIDEMKPTHLIMDTSLYLKLTECGCQPHLLDILIATSKLVCNQTTVHHSLAKRPHKI